MAKKKTKKKSAPKSVSRRTPWHERFGDVLVERLLAPLLQQELRSNEAMATAPSMARLHTLFEDEFSCSIPRPLFEKAAKIAGISFSRTVIFGLTTDGTPATLPTPRPSITSPASNDPSTEPLIPPEPEGEAEFKVTNDGEPRTVSTEDVRRLAALHDRIAESQGEIPEPIIIPSR